MIGHCEINPVTRSHCPGELFQFDELIALATDTPDKPKETPYTVQVGAFSAAESAAELYSKLSKMGYFTFLRNETLVKVCVGKFQTQQEAQKTAEDLKKKGFGGFVTMI